MDIISQGNISNITAENKSKILKYFDYINKEKIIYKIMEYSKNGLNDYLFILLDILNKSDWMQNEILERIVHLFTSNIIPYIENKNIKECFEIIDMIINKVSLKNKSSFNFLSWIEIIIISISEDISDFNVYEIICIIRNFFEIIFYKLNDCEINGIELLNYPHSNIKFYYYIKQLISLLKNKSKELGLIQLKYIEFMPPILLEENEIKNDKYLIFHYSRVYQNNELYNTINNILQNKSLPYKIIDISLSLFHKLLNNINYYDIEGSLFKCRKKILDILFILISNSNNDEKLILILKYINNNLVEFCNKIHEINLQDLKNNNINNEYIEKLIFKGNINSENEEDIFIKKINEIDDEKNLAINSDEEKEIKEILEKFKVSRNSLKV